MTALAPGLSFLDVGFLGEPRIIATAVLHGPGGAALVDPGPSSTLPTLRAGLEAAGIRIADLTALLLTHIHLDHAGASGTLVKENPRLKVYVHEKGAPHMANPEKLIASATRLWGADMDRLWGEFLPVPSSAIVTLSGGERVEAGGRRLEVAYTPGHAVHHVSYFSPDTGVAFVGDTAGIRLPPSSFVLPPTPPPDIDLDAWRASLERIAEWRPDTVFLTHFGPWSPSAPHLHETADHLDLVARLARAAIDQEGPDETREASFVDDLRRELRRRLPDAEARAYETAARFDLNWRGLERYWRRQVGR